MLAPGMMEEDTITVEGSSRINMLTGKSECTMEETNRKPALLRIPNEIIGQIGAYLEEKGDIAAFVRTCRLFNVMFGDVLYQRDQMYHKYKQDSCLTWAANRDKVDTLKRAIKAGIRLKDHPYLIFVVSCTGSPKCAELVLSTPGINPMAEDDRGWTPITLAASFGHANIVKKLVEHGASCTALTSFGWSPISVACCRGSLGVAKLLLDEYGVSMEGDYGINWSALRSAATFGHADILTYLLKRGADPTPEAGGWSCLHIAADGGHTEAVQVLLGHGFNPSAVADENGWTPLTLAADKGHYDTVELLLDRGVNTEQRCTNRWTALCMAANRGDLRMAMLLVSRGADVMAKAVGGWSPITLAATNGHLDIVNLLLAYGADIHMKTLSGWTPLMAASDGGHASLANILLICGADVRNSSTTGWNSLICAADGRHLQTSRILLSHGADIMATTIAGYTPGIRAAYAGSYRLLNIFLKTKGFRLDHLDTLGRSAFFHAAMRGHTKVIKRLLPLTSMANARDKFGSTPIFAAARNGHRKVVELLINEGFADFAERDFLNCTLFAHAQRSNRRQFVKYLKRHAKQANIPIWLEDPAGKKTQHRWDHATCHCNVCGRASVHVEQAYVCEDCNGGMVLCAECINAGQTCNNINHIWTAHHCMWNDDFGWTPPYCLADANLRKIIEVDDNGDALTDVEEEV
ncbi:ankyrin repeats (3 copies) domain-containing protein [Trichoderma breve]|uniref:Ankyrin repeats (3 copies) domain-containing protein n=1 Tax=Trichoderma breve TaxID=2034170 RepID=A0A9W9JS84_9HYPO|nr:ankyrin repeats (3 copies) domain-containing protein [Trichoderma breve]KAJ4865378.1 ankyrin repeats (3 copies) domain-containing protein [Trichoderma breve]